MDKKIENIAKQIAELEKECQNGNNMNKNMSKMESLLKGVSIKELFEISILLERQFS